MSGIKSLPKRISLTELPRVTVKPSAQAQKASHTVGPSVSAPSTHVPQDLKTGIRAEHAVEQGAILAKLKGTPFVPIRPDGPLGIGGDTPIDKAGKKKTGIDQQAAAVDSQVSVDAQQATSEREAAAAGVQNDAQALQDQTEHIQHEAHPGPPDPDTTVTTGTRDGRPYTQETHYGPDGKPDRVTTVTTDAHGNLTVATEEDNKLRVQNLEQDGDRIVLNDETIDLDHPEDGPVAQRRAETDGSTTRVQTMVRDGDHVTGSDDTWSTQQGTGGIRGEVDEGFDAGASTEVHQHRSFDGNGDDVSFSDTTTYSQGNHRVSRNQTQTFPGGDEQVSWTQEVQEGNDYRAQTTVEGHPELLVQVERHADPVNGTVTEDTVRSNPIDGSVQQEAHTERSYDTQGRLTEQHEDIRDSDGNHAVNDYSATYTTNPDGSTRVHEQTRSDVTPADGHHRVTNEEVDSTDTPDGRRVDNVHTTVDVDGQRALEAEGDGRSSTVTANGQTLHFTADGQPADEATAQAVADNPALAAASLAGLNAIEQGAIGDATGTQLLGPFADHAENFQEGLQRLGQALQFQVEQAGPGLAEAVGSYFDTIGGAQDAASAKDTILLQDVVRYVQEGKKLGLDAWKAYKVVSGAREAGRAAQQAAAEVGPLTRAFGIASAVGSVLTGGYDLYKAFTAENGLDAADAGIDAVGAFASAGVGLAALVTGGPPGWVAAAATLGIQAVVIEGHNIVDDQRRGHPEEAAAELQTSLFGSPLAGLLLHAFFKAQDADELRTHPIDGPLPHL